jgi:hypothetical protein
MLLCRWRQVKERRLVSADSQPDDTHSEVGLKSFIPANPGREPTAGLHTAPIAGTSIIARITMALKYPTPAESPENYVFPMTQAHAPRPASLLPR